MSAANPCTWQHPTFDYSVASSRRQALELLDQLQGQAKLLAGGTDLLVGLRSGKHTTGHVIDISGVKELSFIRQDKDAIVIGALTTLDEVARSEPLLRELPVVAEAAAKVGSQQIRNTATIGGNVCNASPSGDMLPGLIALGATAVYAGLAGESTCLLEDFFRGPGRTCMEPTQLLTEISIPRPPAGMGASYAKLYARTRIDLAAVGAAAAVTFTPGSHTVADARVVLGAVAATPIRARAAEDRLQGRILTESLLAEAGELAAGESRPISDLRASADYRREMVGVLTREALREAAKRAGA